MIIYSKVRAMSLPIVVIVHNVQEPTSWATIFWDNAFSEVYRTPFRVVESAPWWRMAHMLKYKFKQQTAGCDLTSDNLNYLCEYFLFCFCCSIKCCIIFR